MSLSSISYNKMECAICMAVRGNGNALQYSCLDRVAWQATVHGAAKRHD